MAYVGRNQYDYVSPEPAPHAAEAPGEGDLPIAQLFAGAVKCKHEGGNRTLEARTKHRKVCEDNVVPEAEENIFRPVRH